MKVKTNLLFRMLKSMTAYGRSSLVSPLGRFSIELQCVNRKHLDIQTSLPKELLSYDADIKKWIAAEVGRGQVNVRLHVSFDQAISLAVKPNLLLARQIKTAWDQLANDLDITLNDDGLMRILSLQEDILLYEDDFKEEKIYYEPLQEVTQLALAQLMAMKVAEGKALYNDITSHFSKLRLWIKEIGSKAPGATGRFREKLIERLEELMNGASVANDERLLKEVSIYAEKIDIAEELARFDSHLLQVDQLLCSENQSIGKTLEFIVQELNREVNTISSKSSDIEISRLVIDIKSELERIREQIQNIE